jgi:hypothetical protein
VNECCPAHPEIPPELGPEIEAFWINPTEVMEHLVA